MEELLNEVGIFTEEEIYWRYDVLIEEWGLLYEQNN